MSSVWHAFLGNVPTMLGIIGTYFKLHYEAEARHRDLLDAVKSK